MPRPSLFSSAVLRRCAFVTLSAAAILIATGTGRDGHSPNAAIAQSTGTTYLFQMALGNPSNADTRARNYANYLKTRQIGPPSSPTTYQFRYCESYSRYDCIPNWVAWHLSSRDDTSAASRQDNYRTDTDLPSGWYAPSGDSFGTTNDVSYDRGHMCPSGDRTDSVASNSATFVISNFIPQTSDNNQGPWEKLEDYSRSLADSGYELYIVAGDDGTLGKLSKNPNITIPAHVWKVIVAIRDDGAGHDNDAGGVIDASYITAQVRANPNTTSIRIIAVDMPNIAGIRSNGWGQYRVTPRTLEYYTGYNFLSALPQDVQDILENRLDTGATS